MKTKLFLNVLGCAPVLLLGSIDWDGDTSVTSEGFDTWVIAEAPHAGTAPAIDGVVGAGEWDAAVSYPLESVFHVVEYEGTMTASFSAMWDETNLYVLIEATDSIGMAGQGHAFEIYVSTAYTRNFGAWMIPGYEDFDYQISCSMEPLDTFYELGLYSDQDPLPSFERANTVDGVSYVSEVKIAWADLGGLPSEQGFVNSDYIGFDVHTERASPPDGHPNRDRTKLGWAGVEDTAWAATEDWGTLRLLPAGETPVVSLWKDVERVSGTKQAGIGWIVDDSYPFVYSYSTGGWLYIWEDGASLESFYGYDYTNKFWFWANDAWGGWHVNLEDSTYGLAGWADWTP
jgi:hypothetical protein